jgi:hypothetical protein
MQAVQFCFVGSEIKMPDWLITICSLGITSAVSQRALPKKDTLLSDVIQSG